MYVHILQHDLGDNTHYNKELFVKVQVKSHFLSLNLKGKTNKFVCNDESLSPANLIFVCIWFVGDI